MSVSSVGKLSIKSHYLKLRRSYRRRYLSLLLRRCEVCIAGAMGGPGVARARPARSAGSRASIPAVPASKPQRFEQDVQTPAQRINNDS
jgi:hypothetical protein